MLLQLLWYDAADTFTTRARFAPVAGLQAPHALQLHLFTERVVFALRAMVAAAWGIGGKSTTMYPLWIIAGAAKGERQLRDGLGDRGRAECYVGEWDDLATLYYIPKTWACHVDREKRWKRCLRC